MQYACACGTWNGSSFEVAPGKPLRAQRHNHRRTIYGSVTSSFTAFRTNTKTVQKTIKYVGAGDAEDMVARCQMCVAASGNVIEVLELSSDAHARLRVAFPLFSTALRASAGRLKSVAMIPTPDLSHLKSEDYKHIYEPAGQNWFFFGCLVRVQYLLPVRRGYFHSSRRPRRGCRRPPEDVIRYMR